MAHRVDDALYLLAAQLSLLGVESRLSGIRFHRHLRSLPVSGPSAGRCRASVTTATISPGCGGGRAARTDAGLAQPDRWVVSGDHDRRVELSAPPPLLQELLALRAEVLGQVHLVE